MELDDDVLLQFILRASSYECIKLFISLPLVLQSDGSEVCMSSFLGLLFS